MPDFLPLIVAKTRRETADALCVTLDVPAGHAASFRFRPGQHLTLKANLDGEEIRRTYSICSGPDDPDLTIVIKRIPEGRFSTWAFDRLRAGMRIEAMPPSGRFVLGDDPGENCHLLAFAAGAGITPIIAMLDHAMRRQPGVHFILVYGNRDSDSIIFRQRLEDLKDAHLDRLTLVHVLSRGSESDTPLLDGRITADKVTAMGSHLFDARAIDDAYLCGPGTMIRDVRNALLALGMPREHVHHEFFAPIGASSLPQPTAAGPATDLTHAPPGSDATKDSSEIVAVIDGKHHGFRARSGEAVLDAALRAGIRVPYSCKGGMCSTCRARVLEGRADMRVNYSLEPWEVEKGFVLTCQAVPRSDRLRVDYDQM